MNKSKMLPIFLILSLGLMFSFVSAENGAGTEQVACEIDYGSQLTSDVTCNVNYNGTSSSCVIEADNDPYNICYPSPTISISKPSPDEGFSPVPGLSGTFNGVECSKIETSYNTNYFFVNCVSPVIEEEPETEQVVCEIDYGTKLDNDVNCNVNYNGKTASCTIEADSDPYNICYPTPKIEITKPSPDEGFSPVQGLSGTFSGIQCSEVETAYNTNGFFVNCKKSQSTEPGVYSITIKGKLIDQLSGKPVEGAQLMSAYEFSPSNVLTDKNGNFEFSVNSDFKIKEGPETGKSDIGAQWTFFKDCYDYGYIVLQKNYEVWSSGKLQNTYSMALRQTVFDEDEKVKDVSGKKTIDLGSLEIYPNADVSIESDIATSFNVMYKYKNREGYNGPGQSGYTTEHYLSSALPLDYDVYIQFEDASGNEYQSSTYRIPSNARCGVISLEYFNGESEWSVLTEVTPTEESGPVKIEIPEVVKKENPNTISRLCLGCLKDDTCYPLGYRKSGEYCSESKIFTSQLEADLTCENNFECSSNLCIDSQCISSGFWQKIMNWFKNLFG
jgi:hypothetical protein|tara:strand:- start:204 stop:1874 length:1671 start_codon:yes stop_codon:yes gene_type:complete